MAKIWRNLKKNKELINAAAKSGAFIVIDTETTGLKKEDQIVEFAAKKCIFRKSEFVAVDQYHTYIRPFVHMPEDASNINGLTDEFLRDKPEEKEVFHEIHSFLGENPAIGAYNSAFDIRMLSGLYSRCGSELHVGLDVDICKIAKDVFCEIPMPNHKLMSIANAYGVDTGIEFHSAMDDVTVTIRVLNAIIKDIRANGVNDSRTKITVFKLNFREGFRGDKRLYLVTSSGSIYYSFLKDKWLPYDKRVDLSAIDMEDVVEQAFKLAGCVSGDYKDLKQRCEEGCFTTPLLNSV